MFDISQSQKDKMRGGNIAVAVAGNRIGWASWHNEWMIKGSISAKYIVEFLNELETLGVPLLLYRKPSRKDEASQGVLELLVAGCNHLAIANRARSMSEIFDAFMPPPPAQFGGDTRVEKIKEHCSNLGIGCADDATALAIALIVADGRLTK